MARTLSEIYTSAKQTRDEYLRLTEFSNSSKMSIIDSFTWVVSACIWAHETILDVFKVDIAKDLQNRINGTPSYYANALLKYQSGDTLVMSDDGTQFSYPSVDEEKRVVSKSSYSEVEEIGFHDKKLMLKVATGETGAFKKIDETELIKIQSYLNEISFAGTHATVVSRIGDILIPRVTVYYDGAVSIDDVYSNISAQLNTFIANLEFDSVVYAQRVMDAIQQAEHVVDVHIDTTTSEKQGIFVVQFDDSDAMIPVEKDADGNVTSYEKHVDRYITPNAGYIQESSGTGSQASVSTWRQTITIKVEERCLGI